MRKTILTALFLLCSSTAFAATSAQYYAAGVQLYNQKQYNQAISYLKAAVQIDSSNWQAYQLMGNCYYAEGDKTDALTAYDQSLTLHPDPQVQAFADGLRPTNTAPALLPVHFSTTQAAGPVVGGGNFGIGLEVGSPAGYGATGKFWLDQQSALQGEVKIQGGTLFQLAYLWHDFDLIKANNGAFAFYIGIGGDVAVGGGALAAGAEAPVGITYLFQRSQIPIDIYIQAEPTFWLTPVSLFEVEGNIGARYYF